MHQMHQIAADNGFMGLNSAPFRHHRNEGELTGKEICMMEKELVKEAYGQEKRIFDGLPDDRREWLPTVEDAEYFMRSDPQKYIPFVLWLLGVSGIPDDKKRRERWDALVALCVEMEKQKPEEKCMEPIQDIYMQFDRYTQISNEVDQEFGDQAYDISWPEVGELRKAAHDDFPANLRLFIMLDEHGRKPETDLEKRARRYVSAVLRNHVVFQTEA